MFSDSLSSLSFCAKLFLILERYNTRLIPTALMCLKMVLKFVLICAAVGCVQGTKLSPLEDVVYVSKVRGQAKSDICGSKSLPCKFLQDGINKLQWGGTLFVDGDHTTIDPYMCESSAGKLVVKKKISIQSYTTTAQISCKHGLTLMAENDSNPGMNVTISGVQLKNTRLYLRNVNATIHKCVFLESSPAITVVNSQSLPLYSLDIKNSVFNKNHGCIDLMQTTAPSNHKKACSRLLLKLNNVFFQENDAMRNYPAKGGLVFVYHKSCFCRDVSFSSTWFNVTVIRNKGKAMKGADHDQRMQNINDSSAKSFKGKRTRSEPILDSVFVVYTCSANITLKQVTSDYNNNMRFLGLQSCHSNVQIYKCSFHRHIISGPGGVVYIPTGEFSLVIIKDSDFSRNMGSIGGVLQVDGGAQKIASLELSNVNFLYCSGNITGCAVSIGNVDKRGVHKVFAILRGVLFKWCHNKIKKGSGRNKHGPLCLKATKVTFVRIRNSTFLGNKNRKSAAVNIMHSPPPATTNTNSSVDVQITRTLFEQNACDTAKPTLGIFIVNPTQVKRASRLIISHSVFVRNRGTVISVDNFQDIKIINMTCSYNKGLCYDFYIGKRKKLKSIPPGLNATCLIENSMFFRNYRSFIVKYVQPNFIDIKVRNITISENAGSNLAVFQFGSRRLQNLKITGTVLFERVSFISNAKTVGSKANHLFGIIVPESHDGNITFIFRKSEFKNNFHRNSKTRPNIPEKLFFFQLPGDQAKNRTSSCSRFPSYEYRNSFVFEDVVFENNTGPSFVSYIANGKNYFINCLFKNNYSFKPKTGAHLFIQEGNTSVEFRNTNFIQTVGKPSFLKSQIPSNSSASMMFVFAGARGPLVLRNSNFVANDSSDRVIPHFTIQTEGYVHIDNRTKLLCPVGSFMDVEDGSHLIHQGSVSGCINITQLKFICKMCGVGKYSLERGSYQDTLKPITCLELCPFGAECTWNIQSRPNFWGYVTTANNSPQLNFTRCPENYCRVPKSKTNTSVYNRCSGSRTGLMCGACKEGFTESMFNHKCRPEQECRDVWFWVVAGLFSVIMAGYLLCKPQIVLYLKNNLIWFRQKNPPMLHRTHKQPGTTDDSHGGHGYSKIIFYFYQVSDLLMLDSSTEILHKHIFISTVIGIYNFKFEVADSSFGCPFPGLTAVTKELFRSLQVFAVMVSLVVLYLLHSLLWLIRRRPRPYFAPYLAAIIEVLLLGYERLGHTSLKLLNCVPLVLHGREEWRLVLDGNITCWVHWWQYVMIAYNIVFVIPFLLVLLVGTPKLEREKISALQFVAACFLPLPFLICWMVKRCLGNHSADDYRQTRHQSNHGEEKRKALLGVLQGPFRPPDNESRGASYWESILIGRRLVFLCMYSFISTPMLRMLLMTAVSVVILVHNIIVRPYKDNKAHIFGVIMLSIHVALAIVNLCKSVLVTVGVTPTGPTEAQITGLQFFEVTLLGILPLIFLLLIVLTLLSQIIRVFVFVIRFFLRRSEGEVRLFPFMNKRDNDCYRPLLVPCEEEESPSCSTGSEAQEKDVFQ